MSAAAAKCLLHSRAIRVASKIVPPCANARRRGPRQLYAL